MTEASIFAFLERKSPNAVHFVLSGVAKLLAKLVKLFWLTENEPENILGKISAFYTGACLNGNTKQIYAVLSNFPGFYTILTFDSLSGKFVSVTDMFQLAGPL